MASRPTSVGLRKLSLQIRDFGGRMKRARFAGFHRVSTGLCQPIVNRAIRYHMGAGGGTAAASLTTPDPELARFGAQMVVALLGVRHDQSVCSAAARAWRLAVALAARMFGVRVRAQARSLSRAGAMKHPTLSCGTTSPYPSTGRRDWARRLLHIRRRNPVRRCVMRRLNPCMA